MHQLKSDRLFLRLATATLVFLYLVILAGSVVRATGSGMGCPDWPKCFGYFIPPTDPSQVEFHDHHAYEKGMMIIVNDTLWRATSDFTSGANFDRANWEKYPNHDYAKFFVAHTWTEYINRLLGALSSFSMTLLLVFAVIRRKKDMKSLLVIAAGMCLLAFVIWLGKVVVDTNLGAYKITMHMLSSLGLVTAVIIVQSRTRSLMGEEQHTTGKMIRNLLLVVSLLTLDQVIFGTQVRQQIDTINSNMGGLSRETWIGQLGGVYLYHKIMAGLVMLMNISVFYLLWKTKPEGRTKLLAFALLLIMMGEYGAGVFMHNFSIPQYAQPVHLLLAMILFGVQLSLFVRTRK
jgi:cytochrome c oxidase assembly protein subunit 15